LALKPNQPTNREERHMGAKPRGPTGSAKGLPEERVTQILLELVEALPRKFQREEAGVVLEAMGLSDDEAEGILQVLKRMPGLRRPATGTYQVPRNAPRWIRARTWRFSLPRMSPVAALQLLNALSIAEGSDELDPALLAITGRMKRALSGAGLKLADLKP